MNIVLLVLLPLLIQMTLKASLLTNAKFLINKWESALIRRDSRLLNLVPLVPKAKFHTDIDSELNVNDNDVLRELNNSTIAVRILNQIHNENLEKLIEIREKSMELSLKNLNSITFSLLSNTFAFKNLQVKRVRWNGNESYLIEFIKQNDRARPMNRLEELERRLRDEQFRCYGVFHEKLRRPVSFVFIRLYNGLADNLSDLLSKKVKDDEVDSCMFYSINSPVRGLNGIEFGCNLIKTVTKEIQEENSQIRLFSTFSPLPLFRNWLQKHYPHLANLSHEQVHSHKFELLEACSEYLTKGDTSDPVAKFHYRNGAILGRINFAADMNEHNFKQSYGIQVNYIYHHQ